jgi:hypothetical protein
MSASDSSVRLLPLELVLQSRAQDTSKFPDRTVNYFDRYLSIKDWLTKRVYRNAGAGLAARDGILYTQHDLGHFEDVIESAGRILGVGESTPLVDQLNSYEIYVLLLAILLHDAGNAEGREGHERRAFSYLRAMGDISGGDSVELRMIAKIARAHGGKAPDGNKDTIGVVIDEGVTSHQNIRVRSRLLAALLRIADEISEGPSRANEMALNDTKPDATEPIHHLYCKVVRMSVDLQDRSIRIIYDVARDLLDKTYNYEGSIVYLVDYIAARLEKCDRERQYCNRFMAEIVMFERIRARLLISDNENEDVLKEISIELRDEGYPATLRRVQEREPMFSGEKLAQEFRKVGPGTP